MQINEAIKRRKSIRKYKTDGVVTDEQIKLLLEAGMLAPSACGMRPWDYIVVQNRDYLDKIIEFHDWANMLKTASCAIIVTLEPDKQKGVSGEGMWQHDGGATVENILLQATELGLGTCWCGLHPVQRYMDATRKLFDLPDNIIPFAVIAVGMPDETDGSRGFYEEDKVRWVK